MLDHFGLHAEARRVETATGSGVLTRDIGRTSNTDEVTDAIIATLSKALTRVGHCGRRRWPTETAGSIRACREPHHVYPGALTFRRQTG